MFYGQFIHWANYFGGMLFVAQSGDEGVKMYWGVGGDGWLVISDSLEVIKASCAKSFAPFPTGRGKKITPN